MLNTPRSRRCMVTAPHHLASQAGLSVLREGGTAIEAVVAMAATLTVVYPHMTGIGGDGFWLVAAPGAAPLAISAAGPAGSLATPALYRDAGHATIPWRGPLAANTVAAAVEGWRAALEVSAAWGGRLSLGRLFEEAIAHAEDGYVVTRSQHETTAAKLDGLRDQPGFAETFLDRGAVPAVGAVLKRPAIAATLRRLAGAGLDDFYRGRLAAGIAADLARLGAPVTAGDLAAYRAWTGAPLSVRVRGATLFNQPPPTQGVASLMILALFDRLGVTAAEGFEHLHGLVEATKQAFLLRDRHIGDPAAMTVAPADLLAHEVLNRLAARIDPARALPWPAPPSAGDTTWMGAVDRHGAVASYIQSIYFEFGSGLVLPESGLNWQNRGCSFALDGAGPRVLAPGRLPFHTLNPALARFDDGRTMVYGTMGGEGQPQTQAAVFSRYAFFGQELQQAVTAPRWLLGRTWGEDSVSLKLEARVPAEVVAALRAAGHAVELTADFTETMGHAGALVRHADGVIEGATDPRSDGAVAAW